MVPSTKDKVYVILFFYKKVDCKQTTFQKDYGYTHDSGIFEKDFREGRGQEREEDILLGKEGNTQIVYFSQLDEKWADEAYGRDKIGTHMDAGLPV